MLKFINKIKSNLIAKVNDILNVASLSLKRIKIYNKISRCYTSCQYIGITTFGLCGSDGKPTEICKKVCPHYIDLSNIYLA